MQWRPGRSGRCSCSFRPPRASCRWRSAGCCGGHRLVRFALRSSTHRRCSESPAECRSYAETRRQSPTGGRGPIGSVEIEIVKWMGKKMKRSHAHLSAESMHDWSISGALSACRADERPRPDPYDAPTSMAPRWLHGLAGSVVGMARGGNEVPEIRLLVVRPSSPI